MSEEVAKYECDDSDDPDRGVLEVFFGGNHDWYVTVKQAEPQRSREAHPALPPSVRFRTSGGSHPFAAILCVAILHDVATGKLDGALERAQALVRALGQDRDVENHWPHER